MRRFSFTRLLGSILIICTLSSTLPVAYAQSSYTMEVGSKVLSPAILPYFNGTKIMVPFRATTEALGGIWLDVPTGTEHKAAVLNDKVLYIVTGLNCQMVLSLSEEIDFSTAEELDDYVAILIPLMLNGTIPVESIDYPIVEQSRDLYIPLEVFTSAFDLDASVEGNAIRFKPGFVYYQPTNFNVTFQLDVTNKTYDGKPFTPLNNGIKVFHNGVQVTDYLPLSFEYMYTDMNADLQNVNGLPVNAGGYALSVRTNVNDPKYSGIGYFSFMIYPAELVLTVKDETILVGDPLPIFSYEVSGIVPGETKADALVEDPFFLIQADTNQPGTYAINASGGKAGINYSIKDYRNGTLIVSGKPKVATVQIRCVDTASNGVLLSSQQQALAGTSIAVSAPVLEGYQVFGQTQQRIIAQEGAEVTFYYTRTGSAIDQNPRDPGSGTHLPYIAGYEDGSFRPENNVTRSETAVMIYRLLNQTQNTAESQGTAWRFSDTPPGTWYDTAIRTLTSEGIVNGYEDGSFRPGHMVTRAEFVAMAMRFSGASPHGTGRQFEDVPQTHWAAGYIQAAADAGMISGYLDGTFRPDQYITRAEAVTVLNRVSGRTECTVVNYDLIFSDVPANHWAYQEIMLASNIHSHS